MELLMEEVADGGGVHAMQMDPLIDRVAVGELMWGRQISHGAACFMHVNECMNESHVVGA